MIKHLRLCLISILLLQQVFGSQQKGYRLEDNLAQEVSIFGVLANIEKYNRKQIYTSGIIGIRSEEAYLFPTEESLNSTILIDSLSLWFDPRYIKVNRDDLLKLNKRRVYIEGNITSTVGKNIVSPNSGSIKVNYLFVVE